MANVITTIGPGQRTYPIYASAARTATPDTMEFEMLGSDEAKRHAHFVLNVSAGTTLSLTFKVEGVDRNAAVVYNVLTEDVALTGVGTTVYKVGPEFTAVTGLVAADMLPPIFRVTMTHGNANSATYSLSLMLQ